MNAENLAVIKRHENNMNAGLGQLEVVKAKASRAQKTKLGELDLKNVNAFDNLKMETTRSAVIEYNNATGYYDRLNKARYAKADQDALDSGNTQHQMHNVLGDSANLARYEKMKEVMEGKEQDVRHLVADAAHSFGAQSQIVKGKFNSYYNYTEATQDIVNDLNALTKVKNVSENIDPIIAGLRTLNMRGDTNLVKDQIKNMLEYGDIKIGSHALQELASFCMFEVKGNDPSLRRFGKYINLQTAKMFNEAEPSERRTREDISFHEYINGQYIDKDADGKVKYNEDGSVKIRTAKKSAASLLKGTSFKDMERTAITTMEELIRDNSMRLSVDENGNEVKTFDYEMFKNNEKAIWDAIMPNVIGDHFSYLSGSEQIVAMSKGITGIDTTKHNIDWKGIFGKDVAENLTAEQKKDYINFLHERTKVFLSGQVPSQIARTKSDMLEAIRNQYTLKEMMDNDEQYFNDVMSKPEFEMNDTVYKQKEDKYLDGVKKEFVESFKKDALKGFVKMHHKGYQGEAKDGLIRLLDPDALYEQFAMEDKKNFQQVIKRQKVNDDDEDDDGAPVQFDMGDAGTDGAIYNTVRGDIEKVYDNYRGTKGMDVDAFWEDVKSIIMGSNEIQSKDIIIENIEEQLPQYTDVSVLYRDIIDQLFGGFGD